MNIKRLYKYFPYLVIIFILVSCASSGTLSGGPKDTEPPKMISEKSSKSVLLDYDGKPITMIFDEYVEIRNKKEIVVSPPTKYPIIVKQRGKKVKIQFDKREELKSDATYFIGLDNVVQDYTEGNKIKDLHFVLSESNIIDSARYDGNVSMPEGKSGNLLVMMYKVDNDSIVAKEKPFYYAKSEGEKFKFNYIKNGKYKVVAFEDKNLNLLYDQNTDLVAFLDTMLVVRDSTPRLEINAFLPKQPLKIIKKNKDNFGQFILEYNQPIEDLKCRVLSPDTMDVFFSYEDQKVVGKYNDVNRNLQLICGEDTVKIKLARVDSTVFKKPLELITKKADFSPLESVVLKWNAPLKEMNKDSIQLFKLKDTIETKVDKNLIFKNDSLIISALKAGNYKMLLDTMALVDIYGRSNDSLVYNFKVLPDSMLVDVKLQLDSTFNDVNTPIVVKLFAERQKINSQNITPNTEITFSNLMPKSYTLTIVKDENSDGKWTTGDYWEQRQPEGKISLELKAIKDYKYWINWDSKTLYSNQKSKKDTTADETTRR